MTSVLPPETTTASLFSYDKNGNLTSVRDGRLKTTSYLYDALNRRTTETPPAASVAGCGPACPISASYRYTLDGLLEKLTDFGGVETTSSYDAARRLTGLSYTDAAPAVAFGYDPLGNRTSLTQGGVTQASYLYDELNRLTSETRDPGPSQQVLQYRYDRRDLVGVVYPDTKQLTYGYDPAGNLTGIELDATWRGTTSGHVGITYDDLNRKQQQSWPGTGPTGASSTWQYDDAGRMKVVEHRNPSGGLLSRHTATYDPAGNRQTQTDEDGTTSTSLVYQYDAAHRLTQEQRTIGASTTTTTYTYDPAGNRETASSGGVTTTYSHDDDNRLTQLTTSGQTTSFQYDRNGSLLSRSGPGGTTSYTYDGARRLTGVTPPTGSSVQLVYDGDGARIKKTVGGQTTKYLNDRRGLTQVLQETKPGGGVLTYVPGFLQHDGSLSGAAQWSYLQADAVSTRVLTDGTGAVTRRWEYEPFGIIRPGSTGSATSDFQFAGEQTDAETGLINLRARYYDPSLGRFLSRDVLSGRPGFPQTFNRFAYGLNNPLRYVDPSGYEAGDCTGSNDSECSQYFDGDDPDDYHAPPPLDSEAEEVLEGIGDNPGYSLLVEALAAGDSSLLGDPLLMSLLAAIPPQVLAAEIAACWRCIQQLLEQGRQVLAGVPGADHLLNTLQGTLHAALTNGGRLWAFVHG